MTHKVMVVGMLLAEKDAKSGNWHVSLAHDNGRKEHVATAMKIMGRYQISGFSARGDKIFYASGFDNIKSAMQAYNEYRKARGLVA